MRNRTASCLGILGIVGLASACTSDDHAPPLQDYKGKGGRPATATGGSGNDDDASAGRSGGRSSGGSTASNGAGGISLVDAAVPDGVKARLVGDGLRLPMLRVDSYGDIILAGATYRGSYVGVGKTFDGDAAGIFVGKYRADDLSPVYENVFRLKEDSPTDGSALPLLGLALGANDEMYLHVRLHENESVDFGGGAIHGVMSDSNLVATLTSGAEFVQVRVFEGNSFPHDGISVDSDGALVFGLSTPLNFSLNGLVLPTVARSDGEYLSGSAGAVKYSSDSLTGSWATRVANPRAEITKVARPDGTGKIALAGVGGKGAMFLATLDGKSGAVVMEKAFEMDSDAYESYVNFDDIARMGDTYVACGDTNRKLSLDGHEVLKESYEGEGSTGFVGIFSLADGATQWVDTVDSVPGFPAAATTRVQGARVAALKDSTFAVLFTQLVITPARPENCQSRTASIHRYDASGNLLSEITLKAGPNGCALGDVIVDDMVALADGALALYGRSTGFSYLREGRFLMRLEK